MAALTTNTTIKGDGLKFNVRSMKLERVIDFTTLDLATANYYEIGDLPAGFLPRAIGIVELKKQTDATKSTVAVYLKSDSTSLVSRTLGSAEGITTALMTAVDTGALVQLGVGDTLALKLSAVATTGKVKIVISGDAMTDIWDDGEKRDAFDPKEAIPDVSTTATA